MKSIASFFVTVVMTGLSASVLHAAQSYTIITSAAFVMGGDFYRIAESCNAAR
jgi:hypothetical protein